MDDITGKVALVTGGDRGIGRGVAVALAQAGAEVAINYHVNAESANQVSTAIEKLGRRSISVQTDISDINQIAAMVQKIQSELGPIEILVNNAGVNTPQSWDLVDENS